MSQILDLAKSVLNTEIKALGDVEKNIGEHFEKAVTDILNVDGAVIVSGVGKAGIIGKKISATLASTGTKSIWLDPVNALHGDLGMVSDEDVALLISNSGSSAEILLTAQALKNLGVKCVAMTKNLTTPLAQECEITIPLGEHKEAGPLQLAPSASTTVMLALGDALALTLQQLRNFTKMDYAKYHPAGALGRRLMPVSSLMRTGNKIALANKKDSLAVVLSGITKARCGLCIIVDDDGKLEGVYSDGDFRRDWSAGDVSGDSCIGELMTDHCKYIDKSALVGDALTVMHEYKINALPVVDDEYRVVGLLDVQDIV